MGLVAPPRQVIAPIIQTGATIRWIHGNHDTVEYARLWDDAEDWSLHRRVETIAGRRMAGIGGVFRGRVWFPKNGDEVPVVRTAAELLRHGQEGQPRFRGGVPLRHRDTILPEDLDAVRSAAADGCDILVTHEAPSCCVRHSSRGGQVLETPQPLGFGGLDDLARDVRARLVVHGHHHHRYEGTTRDGIRVVGLGIADSLFLPADEVL
jgi:Icc-related predicted phosphoesterase